MNILPNNKHQIYNLLPWFVFCFLVLCLIATTILHPLQQDEGVFLTIGQNLAKGYLPYRDFFDHKPPGIYWLFASINYVFGNNIIWYKIILILTNLASAWLVYRISKIAAPFASSMARNDNNLRIQPSFAKATEDRQINNYLWAPIFFLFLTLIFEGQYLIAEPFVAFFLSLGLYLYLKWGHCEADPNRPRQSLQLILSGLSFGLALLFKQTAILSIFAVLIYLIWQKQWKQLAFFCLGAIIPIIATILYLWHSNLLSDAYRQIILYNFQYYPSENILKVIGLLSVPFLYTLPVWILIFYGIYVTRRVSGRVMEPAPPARRIGGSIPEGCAYDTITLLALLPIPAYLGRHYPHYWLQSAPFVAILASLGFNWSSRAKLMTIKIILLIFILFSISLFTFNFLRINYPKYLAEQKLTQFLQQQNQPIYTENQFIGLYFLTQKTPPSRYLYITEISDWSEQSEQKTLELLKNNNALVVWPADSNYAYARHLQQYILAEYKPIFWQHDLGAIIVR